MFRKSHCAAVPLAPTNITNASKYISFTSAYIAYRDLELHRSSAASNSILVNGGATTTTTSANNSELDSSKMREKLAALEDLNELLEEPVEEQVRFFLLCTIL